MRPIRAVRPTVLIVGEGDSEACLLRHIRSLYTNQGHGFKLIPGNARGKGAQNVVEHAIRHSKAADYDYVAALFDTDTDWTPAVRKRAKEHKVATLQSEPCLEAWLLAVAGEGREGESREQKRRFYECFGFRADEERVFLKYFPREVLDAARAHIGVLDQLLKLIGA